MQPVKKSNKWLIFFKIYKCNSEIVIYATLEPRTNSFGNFQWLFSIVLQLEIQDIIKNYSVNLCVLNHPCISEMKPASSW